MRKLELLLDSRDLTPLGQCCPYNIAHDARDYVWVQDHEGPLPQPAQDQAQ